jgi:tRNA threonylcarbamoyladenosine biosynthesis protein TsaB
MGASASGAILVLDTSGLDLAAALVRPGRPGSSTLVHRSDAPPSEKLRPVVLRLLEWEGISRSDLVGLAVVRGPGSFTGLRVGLSFGLGLAASLGLPTAGIGTLEALAEAARAELGEGRVATFLSTGSRRREWYAARFRVGPGGMEAEEPIRIVPAEGAAPFLDGVDLIAGDLPLAQRPGVPSIPRDRILDGAARLAAERFAGPADRRERLVPLYVVETVAVPPTHVARDPA